jgi:hypothetical protein
MRAQWLETIARASRIAGGVAAGGLAVAACTAIVGVRDIHTADAGVDDSALGDAPIDDLGMIVPVNDAGVDGPAESDGGADSGDGSHVAGDGSEGGGGEGGDACQSNGMACNGVPCGTATDNCDASIACPNTCTGSESCVNNVCTCTPNQTPCNGVQCGTVSDGCGHPVTCDTCPATDTCTPENTCQCMASGATTCGTAQCGPGTDSCNNPISCGTCGINHTCNGSGACECTCSNGCFTDGTCCAVANLAVSVCYCGSSSSPTDSWFGTHINGCPLTCTGANPTPVAFNISSDELPQMTALNRYKYQDSDNETRYFLSILGCESIPNCSLDTTLGYVYTSQLCGTTIPLYRYYDTNDQNRWSTTSATAPSGYMSQVITGYGWAP